MKRFALAVASIATIAGCASMLQPEYRTVWDRKTGDNSAAALEKDNRECGWEVDKIFATATERTLGLRTPSGMMNACLEARGWNMVRTEKIPASPQK